MPTYRAFAAESPPTAAAADSAAYSMGMEFWVTTACKVTQIHFWQPTTNSPSSAVRSGAVFSVDSASTGTNLTGALTFAATTTGWNTLTLPTPLALVPGRRYKVVILHPAGRYAATSNYFTSGAGSAGLTNGPLVLAHSGNSTGGGQDTFTGTSALVFPTSNFNGANYWMDVTVQTLPQVDAGVDALDVALGTVFTRTATENDQGAAITSRAWTIVSGPAGAGSTIGTAAALSWTPTAPGAYVLRYSATNTDGTGTDDVAVTVGRWTRKASGVAGRNGTASHTIDFGFTSTAGRQLVFIVGGPVTHTNGDGWTERLQPANATELSVFTKTSAGESSITLAHNGSGFLVAWTCYEFPSGSAWVNGVGLTDTTSAELYPTLTGLPGTAVEVFAARTRSAGSGATGASTVWTAPFVRDAEIFTPYSTNDGVHLAVGHASDVTASSVTPEATYTYLVNTSTFAASRERVVFAMSVPTGPNPPTVVAGVDRPVVAGGSVTLDVVATPAGGETITAYAWTITAGAGSLTGASTATPSYIAPSGSTGTATISCSATASGGGAANDLLVVGYGPTIVAAENQLAGTARSTWDLVNPNYAGAPTLQGFADGFSYNRDQTVNFKIAQTDAAGWSGEIYRLGYYAGNGARLVGTVTPTSPQLAASQAQPAPGDVDPVTALISADCSAWAVTGTWTPPAHAASGMYLLRLNRVGGGAAHVMFLLRDDARTADLAVMPSDSTWQAYNAFGGMDGALLSGNSLYLGTQVLQADNGAARFVSYDRPIVNRAACNTGQSYGAVRWSNFFTSEYPMVRFLERNGYDVKYLACIDAAGNPSGSLLSSVKAGMFIGHNEYWSDGMRSCWAAAKASGKSLFSCASNEVFWRMVGSAPDSAGRPRVFECYKSTISGRGSTGRAQWTGTWRDPDGAGKGGNDPESLLTGTIFIVNGPDLRALVVPADGGFAAQPLWRGTSVAALTAGQSATIGTQILGFEWDTYGPAGVTGPGAAFLPDPHAEARFCSSATYSIASGILLTDAGDQYTEAGTAEHRLVVTPSSTAGGITFGTGTMNWALGLDNSHLYQGVGSDQVSALIQQATVNILADMGAQPATPMAGVTTQAPVQWFEIASPGFGRGFLAAV